MNSVELTSRCIEYVKRELGDNILELALDRTMICKKICNGKIDNYVLVCSMLYDVISSENIKLLYDLNKFLEKIFKKYEIVNQILVVLNTVSYSVEMNNKKRYYEKMLKDEFLHVRNVVSDANKCVRFGKIGYKHYVNYMDFEGEMCENDLIYMFYSECRHKIFKLFLDNFLRTDLGRRLCKNMFYETIDFLINYFEKKNNVEKIKELVEYRIEINKVIL